MAAPLNHQVQMALEVTRGTAVTPMTLEVPIVGAGFKPTLVNALGEVLSSSTFPYRTIQVPVGVTASIAMEVDLNINTIRDMILLATKRTSGVLPSVTIIDDQQGVGVARYSGCVCRSLGLSYSRSAQAGNEAVLKGVMAFECMKVEVGQGSQAALSQATGNHFQIRRQTTLVNNVSATKILSTQISIENGLALGPVDSSNVRLYITDDDERVLVTHMAMFDSAAWRTLLEASTAAATNTITIATGTTNETVTATIATAQLGSRETADQDGAVTEQITLNPYGSSAVAWSFGSSIGASVLGL